MPCYGYLWLILNVVQCDAVWTKSRRNHQRNRVYGLYERLSYVPSFTHGGAFNRCESAMSLSQSDWWGVPHKGWYIDIFWFFETRRLDQIYKKETSAICKEIWRTNRNVPTSLDEIRRIFKFKCKWMRTIYHNLSERMRIDIEWHGHVGSNLMWVIIQEGRGYIEHPLQINCHCC